MGSIRLRAYAKVNYSLDVVGIRPDGYHEIRSVFQSISLADEVEIQDAPTPHGLTIASSNSEVGPVQKNTVYAAWRLLREACGRELAAHVELEKAVPLGAGLGGGSANGAAALVGFNEMFDLGLSIGELVEIAAGVGADVPFCVVGGTMLGEGIGEKLTPLGEPPEHHIALLKPGWAASTAEIYRDHDRLDAGSRHDTENVARAIGSGSVEALGASVGNDLTGVTEAMIPEIKLYTGHLIGAGALGASMSGSGSTVFGIFTDARAAGQAINDADADFCSVVHPVSRGVEIVSRT